MSQQITISKDKLKQILVNANSQLLLIQDIIQSETDDDHKFLETDILSQMTTEEITSLQSGFKTKKLISGKLNWSHIASAVMHELDENISFHLLNIVKKFKNPANIHLSKEMKEKLSKKISKNEISYIEKLIKRATENINQITTSKT
eukprot:263226_1